MNDLDILFETPQVLEKMLDRVRKVKRMALLLRIEELRPDLKFLARTSKGYADRTPGVPVHIGWLVYRKDL